MLLIALIASLTWISVSLVVALGVGRVFAQQSRVAVPDQQRRVASSELYHRSQAA